MTSIYQRLYLTPVWPQRVRSKEMQKGHRRAPKGNAKTLGPAAPPSPSCWPSPFLGAASQGHVPRDEVVGTAVLPPHLKSLLPSPSSSTSGCSWGDIEVAACFPEARDTRGTSGGRRREPPAGPVDFSLPLPNRRACRCHAEPRRRGRPCGHAPVRVPAARQEEAPESPLS